MGPCSGCGSARSAHHLFPRVAPSCSNLSDSHSIPAAPNAASTWHNPAQNRLPCAPAVASYLWAATLRHQLLTSASAASPLVTKGARKVRAVPVPLRGPSSGSATSAPKQHGASRERRRYGRGDSAPQKYGEALGAAFAPDGYVTSGAEEAEWCSEGQTKGGAGGAQWPAAGLSGRGPGAACRAAGRGGPR